MQHEQAQHQIGSIKYAKLNGAISRKPTLNIKRLIVQHKRSVNNAIL